MSKLRTEDNLIRITGYPDAAKLIAIGSPKAKRLADLALHREDLGFARDCLGKIRIDESQDQLIQKALWRAAMVSYFKCFGDGNRAQLSADKLLKKEPPKAMEAFVYFKSLRNKHVVHDENSYTQTICGAVINKPESNVKVEQVVTFSMNMNLDAVHLGSFRKLVDFCYQSVSREFEELGNSIRGELESQPYSSLMAMPSPTYRAPGEGEVHHRRGKL